MSNGTYTKNTTTATNARSIISCIVGHVDAGKTSLSDNLRQTHVQKQEVGGITQRIGGTTFTKESLKKMMGSLCKKDIQINGLLLLDTPGHSCYSHMRLVGMETSDLVIVVVDIMRGLEKETINCLKLLQEHEIPFIIALNKIDRIHGFKDIGQVNLQKSFKVQEKFYMEQLKSLSNKIICELASVGDGINAALYYENTSIKDFISMVPVSAKLSTGIPDLVMLITSLAEKSSSLKHKLKTANDNYGYLIETMKEAKLGSGYMAILRDGKISPSNKILCLTESGPKEAIVSGVYSPVEGSELKDKIHMIPLKDNYAAASCILFLKIETLSNEDHFLNGTPFYCIPLENEKGVASFTEDQVQHLASYKEKIHNKLELCSSEQGLFISAPTLGMLYACVNFADLKLAGYTVGNITKTDIIKASSKSNDITSDTYLYNKRHHVVLNYNTPESVDAQVVALATTNSVTILSNNLIHKLFEEYDKFIKGLNNQLRERHPTIIPLFQLQILQQYIFRKNDPVLIGVKVSKGILKKDSFICAVKADNTKVMLGQITNIQKNKKDIIEAKINEEVCIRIETKLKYGEDFLYNEILETYYSPEDLKTRKTFPDVFENIV